MERTITGFTADTAGDWVAELSCGHRRHVRHRPPFEERRWVLDAAGRAGRVGTGIDCGLCDRGELPEGLVPVRTGPVWDESTFPPGLGRRHRLPDGTWGRLRVHEGRLRVVFGGSGGPGTVVGAGDAVGLPPGVTHAVVPEGPVRFSLDLFGLPDAAGPGADPS